ncbi:hypothetical protein BC936DRAFT_142379 [Jimgerdemannia flammicorona]|uniref:CNNM transmembrane domain-containing protein n=1 Tax=Jimgerdemannia flammicorona TaxID=994334 RepID=A0A433DF69_9FUNG|nr:hypothetical protein BC936DRAFT_142379 [Jimgerdemannia flammicorona]
MLSALFEALFLVPTIHCDCTALVVVGNMLPSTIGSGRFSSLISSMIYFTPYLKGVIVGLILSDGWLTVASKTHKNARLGIQLSLASPGGDGPRIPPAAAAAAAAL